MERRLRKAEWIGVLLALALMLTIAFWPTPVDAPIDGALIRSLQWFHSVGGPAWVDYEFLQVTANVALFIPLGALIASVMWPSFWWASAVLGLAVSLSIELAQYLVLPHRLASAGDLVANTCGALLGGAVARAARNSRSRAGGKRA